MGIFVVRQIIEQEKYIELTYPSNNPHLSIVCLTHKPPNGGGSHRCQSNVSARNQPRL